MWARLIQKLTAEKYILRNFTKIEQKSGASRTALAVLMLTPLAACGGGYQSPTATPPPPPPPPPPEDPDFNEDPTNTFTARDDGDRTLDQGSATADLTVLGAGGNDTITTGSGNDMIRGGLGQDSISAGAGDDIIVVVGTTTSDQYSLSAITDPDGSGVDLSSLVSLENLNDRTESEAVSGETIDGGAGNNTLYVFGTADLSGLTLTNVTRLQVNSTVTLTPAQIAQFTTVDGDGNSVLNIVIPEGSGEVILDLSAVDISDIQAINIDGNVTVKLADLGDVAGIGQITVSEGSTLKLEVSGGAAASDVSLQGISDVFAQVDSLHLGENVTLLPDAPEQFRQLGITKISRDSAGEEDLDNVFSGTDGGDNYVSEAGNDTYNFGAGLDQLTVLIIPGHDVIRN